jgi:hypothetical protein
VQLSPNGKLIAVIVPGAQRTIAILHPRTPAIPVEGAHTARSSDGSLLDAIAVHHFSSMALAGGVRAAAAARAGSASACASRGNTQTPEVFTAIAWSADSSQLLAAALSGSLFLLDR